MVGYAMFARPSSADDKAGEAEAVRPDESAHASEKA